MQVVVLCGGKGTRMGKDLQGVPKPLIKVGRKPILWHILKYYAHAGFADFILCLGYKGNRIREYFRGSREFKVTCVNTGLHTHTGGRLKRIEKYITGDTFFATYGDGLADVNLRDLLDFHHSRGRLATLTAVRPHSTFGIAGIDSHTSKVTHFEEKPLLDHWINGGFFVFDRRAFRFMRAGDVLERQSFSRLLKQGELAAYKHEGFWECMDTYKDNRKLNELWASRKAPWKTW
ncbi:MAG: NTP transferase domain-containing protein [Candidatus Omnitrophica bacterium]|nr:NTP transferase domain-containing protein [Candidatus Omnitrophota bacterium]